MYIRLKPHHVITYYAIIAIAAPVLFLWRNEPIYVTAKFTIFPGLSLQENKVWGLSFFLRHAIWGKRSVYDLQIDSICVMLYICTIEDSDSVTFGSVREAIVDCWTYMFENALIMLQLFNYMRNGNSALT
jgi:hypothetical protein